MPGIVVKPDAPIGKTDSPRDLYKALRRGHLFDYEMRHAKKDAADWRAKTVGKKRPEGLGERVFTIPETLWEYLRESNRSLYEQDRQKFMCWVFHNWSDFVCIVSKCPWCGRK